MARKSKAPARLNAGAPQFAYDGNLLTLDRFRAQALAARYALPIEIAATVAALALGSAAHG